MIYIYINTQGEGYHNFHHEFPGDYRSGIQYTDLDITKWCIYIWSWIGLASNLQYMSDNEIHKTELMIQQQKLDTAQKSIQYPPDDINLSCMSRQQMNDELNNDNKKLYIVLDGYVLDISEFHIHPVCIIH